MISKTGSIYIFFHKYIYSVLIITYNPLIGCFPLLNICLLFYIIIEYNLWIIIMLDDTIETFINNIYQHSSISRTAIATVYFYASKQHKDY